MTATGTSNLVYCDIDDYHTDLLFYRTDDNQAGEWKTQSVDVSISSNNRWSLGDGGYGNKGTISNQQRYAPGTAIDGLVDIKNPHNQMFTNGEYSVTLAAHQTYEFKILETSTLYGLNDLIATSSISNQTLNTSGYQVRLCTAGAGTYTFAYNSSTHNLSITYPETSHPSIDYCYIIDYSWSPSANLHLWDGTSTKVAEWNGSSTIAGSTWPGAAVSNKTTIGGQSYFYIAPGEFDYFMLSKNGDNNDRSGEIQQTSDITYRVYDFGRVDAQGKPRELHIEQAKEAIDYQVWPEYRTSYDSTKPNSELIHCPYFTVNRVVVQVAAEVDLQTDSFVVVVCLWGEANINGIRVKQGETLLVPASENVLYIFGNATFLTATM